MHGQVDRWDQLASEELDAAVIDPQDRAGRKNRYIANLRNRAILESIAPALSDDPVVLDFGCGNGGISAQLSTTGCRVVGVDISMGLLLRTVERRLPESVLFVRYDGERLPLRDESLAGAVTWVVLNHIIDDVELLKILRQINRAIAPGGRFVAVEQVRRTRTIDLVAWQSRRTIKEFMALFEQAGFRVLENSIVRYGKLPTTYAIRYGWMPERLHGRIQSMERWIGRWIGVVPWDYCDVRFVLSKD